MSDISSKVKPDGHAAYLRRVASAVRNPEVPGAGPRVAGTGDPARPGLGNNTKSRAAFDAYCDENPDVIQRFIIDERRREPVQVIADVDAIRAGRQGRYAAQSGATSLLFNHATPRDGQFRVTGCNRRKIGDEVAILHSPLQGKAHYGNLMICGSVWTCPVCAAKISEARKEEIKLATDAHRAAGGFLYMVTHTFAHTRSDDLVDQLKRFGQARQWMRAHRAYKQLRRDLGYVGDIRAIEVTFGENNGWHPHEHGLWFVCDKLSRVQLRQMMNTLFTLWHEACSRAGLGLPNRKRGVNIIECQSAADYMAKMGREQKWGIASELSKQHIKVGKEKGLTPFDLLRSYLEGNKRHGVLFISYAKAFFGKRQIMWSKGLKAIFLIQDIDDQQHAEETLAPDSREVLRLSPYEWRVVLDQPYDVRALVLHLAEAGEADGPGGGVSAVRIYVDRLVHLTRLVPF